MLGTGIRGLGVADGTEEFGSECAGLLQVDFLAQGKIDLHGALVQIVFVARHRVLVHTLQNLSDQILVNVPQQGPCRHLPLGIIHQQVERWEGAACHIAQVGQRNAYFERAGGGRFDLDYPGDYRLMQRRLAQGNPRPVNLDQDVPTVPVGVGLIGCDALRGADCHEVVLATRPNIHSIPRSSSVLDDIEMDTTRNALRWLAGEW
ncbi:hypothetical protein D3C76_530340 [compost metagenome]